VATLLVVHHTTSPALQTLLESALDGTKADGIEGVEVQVRPALAASAVDVLAADGHQSRRQRSRTEKLHPTVRNVLCYRFPRPHRSDYELSGGLTFKKGNATYNLDFVFRFIVTLV
jgi:hypothetical protein